MSRQYLRSALLASLLAITALAHAAEPSATDIAQAVDQKEFHKADVMLHDVIKHHPGSARAHYMLAQVLGYEQRPADGLVELNVARSIDPKLSFASTQRVDAVQGRLEAEERDLQPAARSAAPALTTTQPTTLAERPGTTSYVGAAGLAWICAIVVLIVITSIWLARRAQRRRELQTAGVRTAQLKELTEMLNATKVASLDARLAAVHPTDVTAREALALSTLLTEAIERVQSGETLSVTDMRSLTSRVNTLRSGGQQSAAAPIAGTQPRENAPYYSRPAISGYSDPRPMPSAYPVNTGVAPPSTVIVQQSNDDGFFTGVLVGEAMRPAPAIIERDVYIDDRSVRGVAYVPADEVVVESPRRYERDDYASATTDADSSRSFDAGNGGSDWVDTPSPDSGSFDIGTDNSSPDF
ncbi:tetratricopeptide repeat protein [Burkholderia gladioli]|uniref:tetratricopeptide repeat protein n=1 Tax=Burkholderia gladioli TaxID=28095 RepID=UPI001640DD42|nr:hypothetical protein [Burkholderia gladioli]